MIDIRKYAGLMVAVVIGLGVQLLLLGLYFTGQNAPHHVAIGFTKAFYKLDPGMDRYLCEQFKGDAEIDPVDQFVHAATLEAQQEGFKANWYRSILFHIDTHTVYAGTEKAEVTITAHRRKAINPIYYWVGKIFSLGQTHAVHETLHLVKENNQWKVCEGLLPRPDAV